MSALPRPLRGVFPAVALAWAVAFGDGGTAVAATLDPARATEQLLSEDGFGACVPEANLDEIWLVLAKGGKGGRVPHVCMAGDCENLPDIAVWAAAQQYPDDIDLDREDVQARYASFVAQTCGGGEAVPDVAAPAEAPAVLARLARVLIDPAPLVAPASPAPPPRVHRPDVGPPSPGPSIEIVWPRHPPRNRPPGFPPLSPPDITWPGDPTPPDPEVPLPTVPLPPTGWLLLGALGALFGLRRGWAPRAAAPVHAGR